MRRALPLLLLLAACPEPAEDPVGVVAPLSVDLVSDDCTPARLTGDGGLQFFAALDDGGFAFTVGQQLQFGPTRDGGSLESVQRQNLPAVNGGTVSVGDGAGCQGMLARWRVADGGLELYQEWPSREGCPLGPTWLPERACTTTRRFAFGFGEPCRSSCVRISAAAEVSCDCASK
jgi:hypothetical protein